MIYLATYLTIAFASALFFTFVDYRRAAHSYQGRKSYYMYLHFSFMVFMVTIIFPAMLIAILLDFEELCEDVKIAFSK